MQNIWEKVLTKLEKRINRPSFNTWLRPTWCMNMENQHVRVGVPDDVFVYWLGEYYVHVITDALTEILGFQPAVSFVVTEEQKNTPRQEEAIPSLMDMTSSGTPETRNTFQAGMQNRTRKGIQVSFASPSFQAIPSSSPNNGQKESPSRRNAMKITRPKPSFLRETISSGPPSPPKQRDNTVEPVARKACSPPLSGQDARAPKRHSTGSKGGVSSRTASMPAPRPAPRSLNSGYTFDSYVAGSGNRFAHAAAQAVASQIASNYNPLFIYGGVGLGKTHLLHAIGHEFAGRIPQSRILYLPSEQFINEMVMSIRNDQMAGFRDKYRNIDLLLVDDIQFIARKERTQEEFFHTFNTLYQAKKQIVLTSDCPPKKIPTIAEQLRSRFEWGLIADIQPPDLETRIAILKKKAESQQICLPDEVALFIATKMKSNIRELEGCLSKIKAYSNLTAHKVSLELVQRVLHDLVDSTPKKVTVELVQEIVANHYHVEPASMKSAARTRKVSLPRQIAMYLARELTNLSLPDIGRNFGGRDHTTVMHACKKVERTQASDQNLKQNIMQIRELITT